MNKGKRFRVIKISKKLKSQIKKRLRISLTSVSLIMMTLAIFKLAGFSMPESKNLGTIATNFQEGVTAATSSSITNASLSVRNTYMKVGTTLDINVLDESTSIAVSDQGSFTWSSSNEDIATVDGNGVVTGKGVGHTTITAYNSSNGKKARAIVNVYRNKAGAITVPQVEEGMAYTIVLKEDGTVWATGYNGEGRLGDGTTTDRNTPGQVKINSTTYLTNVIKISSTYGQTMALTTNGEVYTWGWNAYGQLGQGNTTDAWYATKVAELSNIIDVAMGAYSVFAVNNQGELYGWGYGDYKILLGTATTYKPVKLTQMSNVVSISQRYGSVGAMLANGETWIWGFNEHGPMGNGSGARAGVAARAIGSDITEIQFGHCSGYMLKEDKTVWASGLNNCGQLGLGDTKDRTTYTQVKYSNGTAVKAKTIEVGKWNLQFIGTDGKVYVTGYNGYGQLGDKTTTNALYPQVMKNENGTEVTDAMFLIAGSWNGKIANSPRNMGIVRRDGTVWLAGDNTNGQLGNGTNTSTNYLTMLGTASNEILLNARNEYIKIGEELDIDILLASGFNVFIRNSARSK